MAFNKTAALINSAKNKNIKVQKNNVIENIKSVTPKQIEQEIPQISNAVTNTNTSITNSSPESFIRQLSNENTAQTFAFNAEEAEKARDFSEYMSNTSHQREVEDLKRAGLNPVLSANGGASAYSASSASGSADSSAVGVLGSLYATKLNNDNAAKIAKMQTDNQLKIAKLGNKNATEIAKINAQASKYASDNASSASRYASDNSLYSSKYSADTSYAGTQYSVDRSKYGMIDNFVNSLLGSNRSKGNSAAQNAGNYLKKGITNLVKKFKK